MITLVNIVLLILFGTICISAVMGWVILMITQQEIDIADSIKKQYDVDFEEGDLLG